MKEDEIINLFYPNGNAEQLDDCTFLQVDSANTLIYTTDSLTQDTHFRLDWSSPQNIAHKLLECNVSDITSSAGKAMYAFLNIGLPYNLEESFIKEFANALLNKMNINKIKLMGGDTYRSKNINMSLQLIGKPEWDHYANGIQRKTGKAGDSLYLTGNIGRSLAGFQILEKKLHIKNKKLSDACIQKHLSPKSRLDISDEIFNTKGIQAMMDVSDGLFIDTNKMAKASGISINLDLDKIPVYPELLNHLSRIDAACSGEELELLFLASPDCEYVDSICIGNAIEFDGQPLHIFQNGHELKNIPAGYNHF